MSFFSFEEGQNDQNAPPQKPSMSWLLDLQIRIEENIHSDDVPSRVFQITLSGLENSARLIIIVYIFLNSVNPAIKA